jgi:hypothetical protein
MIRFGPYFHPTGLKPEIAITIPIVGEVLAEHNIDGMISSGIDRKHSRASLHYVGMAVDITWTGYNESFQEIRDGVREAIEARVGLHYDVVFSEGCIHIEYQPKTAINQHWRS